MNMKVMRTKFSFLRVGFVIFGCLCAVVELFTS